MWHKLEEKSPEEKTECPVRVTANHSGYTFNTWGLWWEGQFFFNGHTVARMGWTVLAWYELPEYVSDSEEKI